MGDPVVACAEELMAVFNSLDGANYTSIDQERMVPPSEAAPSIFWIWERKGYGAIVRSMNTHSQAQAALHIQPVLCKKSSLVNWL